MNIEFDSTSMEEINDSIGSNTTLEYLDLSDNRCEVFLVLFVLRCQLLVCFWMTVIQVQVHS